MEVIAACDKGDEQPAEGLLKREKKMQKRILSRIPTYFGVKKMNKVYLVN